MNRRGFLKALGIGIPAAAVAPRLLEQTPAPAPEPPFGSLCNPRTECGDLLIYDGQEWVTIPTGKPGQFLKVQGPSGLPVWKDIHA